MCQAKLEKRHPFSLTLGEGPYRYVGFYDIKENTNSYAGSLAPKLEAGNGTCFHCGRAISIVCIVRRGDGKLFGVGQDCMKKVSAEGVVSSMTGFEKSMREHHYKKQNEKEERLVESLTEEFNAALQVLENKKHPNSHYARQGMTAADYYRFCGKTSRNMKKAIKEAKVSQ